MEGYGSERRIDMRRAASIAAATLLGTMIAGITLMLGASPALAHETRTVGAYHFAVGFGDEPAYTGQKNSVQLFLHDAHDKPVTDLGDTLKVDVSYAGGGSTLSLSIVPDFEVGEFGIAGDYRAWFFPTRPGNYTFHFTGTVKGQNVDESFTSSPTTFSSVEDPTGVEFPAKDPTTAQISGRLQRELPRIQTALSAERTRADKAASGARTFGVIGIVVGVLGLATAVVALARGRRRPGLPAAAPVTARTAETPARE
jgi:hypothetical protein